MLKKTALILSIIVIILMVITLIIIKGKNTIRDNPETSSIENIVPTESKEYREFLNNLKRHELSFREDEIETVSDPLFPVQGKNIRVQQGSEIYDEYTTVFVYANEVDARLDATGFNTDGTPRYKSLDPDRYESRKVHAPHFYQKGSLIVLYQGNSVALIRILEDILGKQFAGSFLPEFDIFKDRTFLSWQNALGELIRGNIKEASFKHRYSKFVFLELKNRMLVWAEQPREGAFMKEVEKCWKSTCQDIDISEE